MDWHRFFMQVMDGPSTRYESGSGEGMARVGIVADMTRRDDRPPLPPAPVNVLWRIRGNGWERWSTAWKDFEADDGPPDTLLEARAERGVVPDGTRFRLVGGEWRMLAPDEPDELPPPPEDE